MTKRHWVQADHPCRVLSDGHPRSPFSSWLSVSLLLPLFSIPQLLLPLCPSPGPWPHLEGRHQTLRTCGWGKAPCYRYSSAKPIKDNPLCCSVALICSYALELYSTLPTLHHISLSIYHFPNIPCSSGDCIRAVESVRTFLKTVTPVERLVYLTYSFYNDSNNSKLFLPSFQCSALFPVIKNLFLSLL